jgi:hypothetical protein
MNPLNGKGGNEWISVKDKLPEEGVNVLCYNENFDIYEVSHRWRNEYDEYKEQTDGLYKKVRGSYEMWSNNDATHWRPLPAPPKSSQLDSKPKGQ